MVGVSTFDFSACLSRLPFAPRFTGGGPVLRMPLSALQRGFSKGFSRERVRSPSGRANTGGVTGELLKSD